MSPARLFLIDSFGFIFRAYHARARSGAPPMRTSSGLSTEAVYIFHNMLRKLVSTYQPEYLAAVFESDKPTFRSEQFAEYKANREEMPPDLGQQIPYVRRILEAMRIPIVESSGFEADDVIGAISRQAVERAGVNVVIVSSDKDMLQLVSDRVHMYNPAKDDTWYDPQSAEAFMGVPPHAVADLLALKGDAIDNIPGAPGIGDKGAKDLILRFGSVEQALERAAEVERKAYRESLQNHRDQILLSKKLATIDTNAPIEWDLESLRLSDPDVTTLRGLYRELEFFSLLRDLSPVEVTEGKDYATLSTPEAAREWLDAVPADALVAVAVSDGGIGLAWRAGEARGLPVELIPLARPLLEDGSRRKTAHDIKTVMQALERHGIAGAKGFVDDVMLAAFLLHADTGGAAFDALAERFLDRKLGGLADARAEAALELHAKLIPEIDTRGLRALYQDIDLPLAPVLGRMEKAGVLVDRAQLGVLSSEMDRELERLTAEIFAESGREFNINSPQQLGKVLFEEMNLPAPFRYGKGKQISTAADVLEGLAGEYPIARLVLEYRQIAKLKGTYVDALPALIHPGTGRVHTTFNQAGAATGRLSSSNPNLQNIPIRTELGRQIRAAFVPAPGWTLVSADYSQIELRLLAHFSGDPVLTSAFLHNEDIHTRTASEVFGVGPLMVSPEMRRSAKAVNFGIVYGQTPFGLASQLGVDRREAEEYIRRYFERYAGVKKWIAQTIAEVRQSGVARNLWGRERPIPDMHARNPNARSFAERTAVNTPLQGSAADLIKVAMIRIDSSLAEKGWSSKMVLQVHDELLFEAPLEEVEELRKLVKREMENAIKLNVPLLVEAGEGPNWRDAK